MQSLSRNGTPYLRLKRGTILRGDMRRGYHCILLRNKAVKKRKQKHASIHHLVARAFIGPRPRGLMVCHWDGFRMNNRASNLIYGTRLENEAHKEVHGTRPKGERHWKAKLTQEKVAEIRAIGRSEPLRIIGQRYGLNVAHVSRILLGKSWREEGRGVL